MTNEITLEDKLVGEISGDFYIPSYQRGYRWERQQVETLLNDIMENGDKPYCLQPVVVRKMNDGRYELIDGQQRLTTIYILLKYLKNEYKPKLKVNYTLSYETREESASFLDDMDETKAIENIDFFFMYEAYQTIDQWFMKLEAEGKDQSAADLFGLYFFPKVGNSSGGNVRFIWYEVKNVDDKDAISLFTRLNIGRIPLTNAELVKALFLCRKEDNLHATEEQLKIALQWDTLEKELHDSDFWNFLTKKKESSYPSRIELIFDLMVSKNNRTADRYSTFYYFNSHRDDLRTLWEKVIHYYYRLKEWYKKDVLYHKIGYLVSSGHKPINEIVEETIGMKKSELEDYLDKQICQSIRFKVRYADLRYDTTYDHISRLLLLFNVISVMNRGGTSRFPFKTYNNEEWSLEHIHPQHPEEMRNEQELWRTWIEKHLVSIRELPESDEERNIIKHDLLDDMNSFLAKEKVSLDNFKVLVDRVMHALSDKTNDDLTHSLSNMALLSKSQNSALNNSLFDVKRRDIIKMDREGKYIPYCTRMVFLKYYTERADEKQMFVWSNADRKAYIEAINHELKDYLAENIEL